MTISNYQLSAHREALLQSEHGTDQQRLSAAEATADRLDFPDWNQIATDGIYRNGYIVTLRTRALQYKVQSTKLATFETWRYSETAQTLFVQVYAPGQMGSVHLRGKIQHQQSHAAIDIIGNGNLLQVGQHLGSLGKRWADWRLISLEMADLEDF